MKVIFRFGIAGMFFTVMALGSSGGYWVLPLAVGSVSLVCLFVSASRLGYLGDVAGDGQHSSISPECQDPQDPFARGVTGVEGRLGACCERREEGRRASAADGCSLQDGVINL